MNRTILYIYDNKFSVDRRLHGILDAARSRGWIVERVEASRSDADLKSLVRYWDDPGAIVDGGLIDPKPYSPAKFAKLNIPVVYCDDGEREFSGMRTSLRHDSQSAASLAVDALLALGLKQYAFVGYHQQRDWSEQRKRTFLSAVKSQAFKAFVWEPYRPHPSSSITEFNRRLSQFLLSLPRPCGIFAASDEIGRRILNAALRLGIVVPDEMPVIGIDNDELTCENTLPTLSSIAPDFTDSGRIAVEMLDERIRNPAAPHATRIYSASAVRYRQSLRRFPVRDAVIIKSIEFIRLNACSGIKVADVIATTGLSRRSYEIRFRRLLGHSVQDEIEGVRLDRARDLLLHTNDSVDAIAHQCGYSGQGSLIHLFHKRLQSSPMRWRLAHRRQST